MTTVLKCRTESEIAMFDITTATVKIDLCIKSCSVSAIDLPLVPLPAMHFFAGNSLNYFHLILFMLLNNNKKTTN